MNFYVKKRSKPTVPIITLIDILAILLIFFIVTTTFKKDESLLNINLPESGEQAPTSSLDSRIPLALNEAGKISLGQELLTIEEVPQALQQLLQKNPNAKIEMKADEKTPLGLMVKLRDAITKAGIEVNEVPLRIRVAK